MNLMDVILQAQGGGAVRQMAQQFGLGEDQAQSALGVVLPMLASAMQQNVQREGGIEGLLGALQGGNHQRYLDDPSALFSQEAVQDGNGILGHLLGSKDVSRQLVSHASAQSGVSADIIKKMLPLAAGLLMGGMGRQAGASRLLGQVMDAAMGGCGGGLGGVLGSLMGGGAPAPQQHAAPASGIMGMLGPWLDQNQNGSAMDEILGMAGQFLGGRK